MDRELNAAIEAALQAGGFLRQNFGKANALRHKSVTEIVTELDGQAEQIIAERLQSEFPHYGFLGEEGHRRESQKGFWVVDPIDGTTNYIRHIPVFAVSIGLVIGNEPVVGVVYQPMTNELFAAFSGGGATLNGQPIRVSQVDSLGKALLGSGFPYDAWTSQRDNLLQWGRAVKSAFAVYCTGVAALGLCDVAAGRLDGYWELHLHPWDIDAGACIVREAGGVVTQTNGKRFDPLGHTVLADNGRIHEALLTMVEEDQG
ncbi:MAG: inositol monophosphatase family protein [Anaerolineales bacterium]|nr:inositol monophosphatase [Anaerolineales bacterium]MCS7248085.1 inositol monophosphatase [Anaerolineales bacterium]MDW8161897.1 inositol monophosphatase family protein [Anaerolineales bacterium]MDW8447564.1 inositol monophosphatase family protein [Anaerolineales bacterium]